MPVLRLFRGREVQRTAKAGDSITVTYSGARGQRKQKETVSLNLYLKEVRKIFLQPMPVRA